MAARTFPIWRKFQPMKAPTKRQVQERTKAFRKAVGRAEWLRDAVAIAGYTLASKPGQPKKVVASKLSAPDKRDIAQFVFFEVAVQFEVLARYLFEVEVRSEHSLLQKDAQLKIKLADDAAKRIHQWGVPRALQARGRDLAVTKMHAQLQIHLGQVHYEALAMAHRLRNRIAHGPKNKHFAAVMNWAKVPQVPATKRQGCSPGALLLHYPQGKGATRAFDTFMAAFRRYADEADARLP